MAKQNNEWLFYCVLKFARVGTSVGWWSKFEKRYIFNGMLCVKFYQTRVVNILTLNTCAGTNCLQKVELFPRPPNFKHSNKMYNQQILTLKKSRAGKFFFASYGEQLFDEDMVMFKKVGGVDGFLRSQVLLDNNQEAFLTWLKAHIRADEHESLAILVQHGKRNQIEACLMR